MHLRPTRVWSQLTWRGAGEDFNPPSSSLQIGCGFKSYSQKFTLCILPGLEVPLLHPQLATNWHTREQLSSSTRLGLREGRDTTRCIPHHAVQFFANLLVHCEWESICKLTLFIANQKTVKWKNAGMVQHEERERRTWGAAVASTAWLSGTKRTDDSRVVISIHHRPADMQIFVISLTEYVC